MLAAEQWAKNVTPKIALDAAGLIALAELPTLARRTAATGSAALSDVLVLCPGIHRQQNATSLNGGEYPITANMTSGYVFRTENQGTVAFFQRVGKPGQLTTLKVVKDARRSRRTKAILDMSGPMSSILLYMSTVLLTVCSLVVLGFIQDYWGLGIFGMLMLARLMNVFVVWRRNERGWCGAREPGKTGDLLVLLSQDRWIRVQGLVDDLKALTSGQWLRETTFFEASLEGCSIVLVYLCAALASNATQVGKIIILVLFMLNAGLLTLSNELMDSLYMKDLVVTRGEVTRYVRRLDMADQLMKESGNRNWAVKIGLVNEQSTESVGTESVGTSPSSPVETVQV